MRLLLACAVVALLIVVWLPSRSASRAPAESPAGTLPPSSATAEPEGDAEVPRSGVSAKEEEKGRGEEGEVCRLTVVSSRDG